MSKRVCLSNLPISEMNVDLFREGSTVQMASVALKISFGNSILPIPYDQLKWCDDRDPGSLATYRINKFSKLLFT